MTPEQREVSPAGAGQGRQFGTTNFGVFRGRRLLGGGCRAGAGPSHCETRLLFLRLPLPAEPEPEGARKKISNGFPEQGHPRATHPPALGHHNFRLSGAGNDSRQLPEEMLPSPPNAFSPKLPPSGELEKGGTPLPCSPRPDPPGFAPGAYPRHWFGQEKAKIENFKSMFQGSPEALSTSCDKTKHASFETYSSSILVPRNDDQEQPPNPPGMLLPFPRHPHPGQRMEQGWDSPGKAQNL